MSELKLGASPIVFLDLLVEGRGQRADAVGQLCRRVGTGRELGVEKANITLETRTLALRRRLNPETWGRTISTHNASQLYRCRFPDPARSRAFISARRQELPIPHGLNRSHGITCRCHLQSLNGPPYVVVAQIRMKAGRSQTTLVPAMESHLLPIRIHTPAVCDFRRAKSAYPRCWGRGTTFSEVFSTVQPMTLEDRRDRFGPCSSNICRHRMFQDQSLPDYRTAATLTRSDRRRSPLSQS